MKIQSIKLVYLFFIGTIISAIINVVLIMDMLLLQCDYPHFLPDFLYDSQAMYMIPFLVFCFGLITDYSLEHLGNFKNSKKIKKINRMAVGIGTLFFLPGAILGIVSIFMYFIPYFFSLFL